MMANITTRTKEPNKISIGITMIDLPKTSSRTKKLETSNGRSDSPIGRYKAIKNNIKVAMISPKVLRGSLYLSFLRDFWIYPGNFLLNRWTRLMINEIKSIIAAITVNKTGTI